MPTPWHHDLTFWPVKGNQICSIWMPTDPVTRESSGLEYARGSHRWNKRFKAVSWDDDPRLMSSDLEDPPDIDHHWADYYLANCNMERGDVLMFHLLVMNGLHGIRRARRRGAHWQPDRSATMSSTLRQKRECR